MIRLRLPFGISISEVIVVAHKDVTKEVAVFSRDSFRQVGFEFPVIGCGVKDLLALISAAGYMIKGAGIFHV